MLSGDAGRPARAVVHHPRTADVRHRRQPGGGAALRPADHALQSRSIRDCLSLLARLGGILLASRIGSSQVNAGGGYLMDAVAAAWIGFSLAGSGKPNALGTLVGAVILGVLSNGLVMLSVPYYAMDIIKGLVLAGALALTYFQRRT